MHSYAHVYTFIPDGIHIYLYYSSYLIYRKMIANASSVSFSNLQERARRRRNRNITLVLIGIIVLFLVCHIGEVAISIYELADVLNGERSPFPKWASNTVIINHLLIVINSSLNFVIYCKDVVFRSASFIHIIQNSQNMLRGPMITIVYGSILRPSRNNWASYLWLKWQIAALFLGNGASFSHPPPTRPVNASR
jgi:hypothetical protein